ncbi:MAG: BamA/TamA family outer membrane protein [Sandarakinorhabdus sp.]|nr:BamA/TamA family outer membrane protein [Sandarakinorhabdus sp.]
MAVPLASAHAQTPAPADVPAVTAPLPPVVVDTSAPRIEDFAPLPGNVPWPTIESTADTEPPPIVANVRYTVDVVGLTGLGLYDEFKALSALRTRQGADANLAQINRRVVDDRDLIDQLLRSIGHYGGKIAVSVTSPTGATGPTRVRFDVDPGPLYRFESISVIAPAEAIGGDPSAIVLPLLGVKPGDAVDAARVNAAQDALTLRLADAGFPFPMVTKPEIVVDHASQSATLVQSIDLGHRGVFGSISIDGQTQGFTADHVAVLARFKPGTPYSEAKRDDLRRAMIQTSLFGTVAVRPVAGGELNADGAQVVNLQVTTEAAPPRTVAASGGYSTGQGIRVEGSWTHRNLFAPEGALTVRGIAAERVQVVGAEFRRRNFRRRDQTLIAKFDISAEQQNAFDASSAGVTAAINRESNVIWQKPITYSLGVEALVTRQKDRSAPSDPNNTYFILALPSAVTWDRSDDLLNPTRGFRLTGRISPEFTLRSGTNFNYFKAQIETTAYQPFGNVVLAGRLHLGAIAGANRGRIAPNRRFYAGGGGSVRGFDFQGVGPKDVDGSPTGGNSLTEAAFEVRYRLKAFGNDIGLVGFVDVGQVYQSSLPRFTNLKVGAGVGVRYFTSFGPIRVDIATPVTRSPGDPKIAFYVSIGQAF